MPKIPIKQVKHVGSQKYVKYASGTNYNTLTLAEWKASRENLVPHRDYFVELKGREHWVMWRKEEKDT